MIQKATCGGHSRAEVTQLGLEGQIQALLESLGKAGTPNLQHAVRRAVWNWKRGP